MNKLAINYLLTKQVYSYGLIIYRFSSLDKPLHRNSGSLTPLESSMLEIIERDNLCLVLTKANGVSKNDLYEQKSIPIYRLSSVSHNAYCEFCFEKESSANILMVSVYPSKSFYSLRDFFIRRVAKAIFESNPSIESLTGAAMENGKAATKRRSSAELGKLWGAIGFQTFPDSYDIILTRESFNTACHSRKNRARSV